MHQDNKIRNPHESNDVSREELFIRDMKFVLATWKRHYPHKLPPMRILGIFESFDEIVALIKKEVTEEFIVKWIDEIKDCIVFDDKEGTVRNFIKMFKEAGIRVA